MIPLQCPSPTTSTDLIGDSQLKAACVGRQLLLTRNDAVMIRSDPSASKCVKRKRVTFAVDDDVNESATSDVTSSRQRRQREGVTSAKRRREVAGGAAKRKCSERESGGNDDLSAVSCGQKQQNDRLQSTMPLQSINYNLERCCPRSVTSSVTCPEQFNSSADDLTSTTPLPEDPRVWSRVDVYNWLQEMRLSCAVEVDADRFRMNGKALCLMTREMFAYRVPHGGSTLYKDFQMRLVRAVAVALHRSCGAGQ